MLMNIWNVIGRQEVIIVNIFFDRRVLFTADCMTHNMAADKGAGRTDRFRSYIRPGDRNGSTCRDVGPCRVYGEVIFV